MFVCLPVPPCPPLLARLIRGRIQHSPRGILPLGLALALVSSAGLWAASASPAAADSGTGDGPSIQYQEAMSHAAKTYSFTPGGPVTIPYRPRFGDTATVDGATPVALPAAGGSAAAAPALVDPATVAPTGSTKSLRREVFGFLPYWELGSTLDYNTLSTIAYFGIGLNVDMAGTDPNNDGALARSGSGWNGWRSATMTSVINAAHADGTRVVLTIESFAWDSAGAAAQTHLLSTPAASQRAAQQIATEVNSRGADGVDLDFEPIAPGQSADYVAFVKLLRTDLDALHPGYELTFCANGAPNTYNLPALLAPGAADAVFIMGYNLRGGSPKLTGSIDPLTSTMITYSLTHVVNRFLSQVPASQVILGLPWYGEAWSTGTSTAVNAPPGNTTTYGQPAEVYYSTAAGLAARDPATTACQTGWPQPCVLGKFYDTAEQTAWTAYYGNYGGTQNSWREFYFDDSQALGVKLDAIDGWNLRGAGIWALGYDNDNGDGDLTNTIATKWEGPESTYHALTPARILDTRSGTGASGPMKSQVAETFQVRGKDGVPSSATAVTGNLTVTGQTSAGSLYIGPVALNNPTIATLDFPKGDNRADGVTSALSAAGTLSVTYLAKTATPTAQAIFDVTGYFTPGSTGATYYPLTPTRLLDTRSKIGLTGVFHSHVARTFQVTGRGGVPAGATAVTGNLTVTRQTSLGFLYIGPVAVKKPTSSTLNFPKGDDRANSVTVALGKGGKLSVTYAAAKSTATAQVVFDVTGYYMAGAGGAMYFPLDPTRILNTTDGTGGLTGAFSSHVAQTFQVATLEDGEGVVPSTASAVTGNLTVTRQTSRGYLFIGPTALNNPTSSTLNFPFGDTRANGVTVALGTGGTLSVTYAAPTTGPTAQVIFDVTGYFAP